MQIDEASVELVRQAVMVALKLSMPVLIAGVIVGLAVSIVQSVTQIQEQTLTLVPKIFVMTVVALVLLPWTVSMLVDFSAEMFRLM